MYYTTKIFIAITGEYSEDEDGLSHRYIPSLVRYGTEDVFLWVSVSVTLSGKIRKKSLCKEWKVFSPLLLHGPSHFSYLNMEKQSSEYIIKEGVERRLIKCVSSFAFMVSITERLGKTVVHTSVIFSLGIKQ